jgi:hypothetical protein
MTDSTQASPIQEKVPEIQAKINPIPQTVSVNEVSKEDVGNQRLYILGILGFVVIIILSVVVGFFGLR